MRVNSPKSRQLTPKQKALLDFVTDFINKNGFSPSLVEMRDHFHLNATSTVHQHLEALMRKGFLVKQNFQHRGIAPLERSAKTVQIPLMGKISAGPPNEPIENPEVIEVPDFMIRGDKNNFYALEVKGESMIEDGIWDGDIILVNYVKSANINDVIVAVVNGEVTLKKFGGLKKDGIQLIPKNPTLKPFYVKPEDFDIRGKFAGLIRR